jgi:hypothetical protein
LVATAAPPLGRAAGQPVLLELSQCVDQALHAHAHRRTKIVQSIWRAARAQRVEDALVERSRLFIDA